MHQPAEYPWSDERFDAFRQVGDPAADAVIAHVLEVHDVATINQMMSYTTNWMRYWLGRDLADALQVPPHDWGLVLVHLTRGLWALQRRVQALSPVVEWSTRFLIRRLLTALIERERDGKDVHFSIPERLKAQWAVRG